MIYCGLALSSTLMNTLGTLGSLLREDCAKALDSLGLSPRTVPQGTVRGVCNMESRLELDRQLLPTSLTTAVLRPFDRLLPDSLFHKPFSLLLTFFSTSVTSH